MTDPVAQKAPSYVILVNGTYSFPDLRFNKIGMGTNRFKVTIH